MNGYLYVITIKERVHKHVSRVSVFRFDWTMTQRRLKYLNCIS